MDDKQRQQMKNLLRDARIGLQAASRMESGAPQLQLRELAAQVEVYENHYQQVKSA